MPCFFCCCPFSFPCPCCPEKLCKRSDSSEICQPFLSDSPGLASAKGLVNSPPITTHALHRSLNASLDDVTEHGRIMNNRLSWQVGFAVEVYSQSHKKWYPGKIIKAPSMLFGSDKHVVDVLYNGFRKTLDVFSEDIQPFLTDVVKKKEMSYNETNAEAEILKIKYKPSPEPITYDAFISHCQKDAQDAAGLLFCLLKPLGVKAWLDMQQDDLTTSGMVQGIVKSRCFVIYLTKTYFTRVFTVFELEIALLTHRPLLVIWEGDERHQGLPSIESYIELCPAKYKERLFEKEALRFERRKNLQQTQLQIIVKIIMTTPENAIPHVWRTVPD